MARRSPRWRCPIAQSSSGAIPRCTGWAWPAEPPAGGSARNAGLTFFELHTGAIEIHRDDRVLADGENDVHHLTLVEALAQALPRGVADVLVAVKFVGGPQERRVVRTPSCGVGSARDPRQLVAAQSDLQAARRVLRPFVVGSTQVAGAQDEQLAIARRDA